MNPFLESTFKCEGEQPPLNIYTMNSIKETRMKKMKEVFNVSWFIMAVKPKIKQAMNFFLEMVTARYLEKTSSDYNFGKSHLR